MPRYFFHVRDGDNAPDEDGTVLPSVEQARIQAIGLIGALLRDNPTAFWIDQAWRVDVEDEVGVVLFAVFVSAIEAPHLHLWHPTLKGRAKN